MTLVVGLFMTLNLQAQCPGQTEISTLLFDFDACLSNTNDGSNSDYSEFTAVSSNPSSCANATVVGGSLYRQIPDLNVHSCTPGVDDTPGMCVSGLRDCNFKYNTGKEVRFDIQVTPPAGGFVHLESLNFYAMAPDFFDWIGGLSGGNDYPTTYSVRVFANNAEIFHSPVNPTSQVWTLESFDFTGNAAFMVNTPTIFSFELLAYCPVGNGEGLSVWDLDNIEITTSCSTQAIVDGGTLEGEGPFDLCVGDGVEDILTVDDINVWANVGSNSMYLLTDVAGNILVITSNINTINFDVLGPGSCMFWHVAHEDNFQGAVVGNNLSQLMGCFSLSNPITINKTDCSPDCDAIGGNLLGSSLTFCVDDGIPETITAADLVLSGNVGSNQQWVLTDVSGNITALPASLADISFEGTGPGQLLIWNLSYENGLMGASVGNNASQLMGCFSLSNPISITKENCVVSCGAGGGSISGGPFEFCVGDGDADIILDAQIALSGNTGSNSQWVVTDNVGNILGLPGAISDVNFDGAGVGVCLIWHLSHEDDLTGAAIGNNANQLGGCFSLSNPIAVSRIDCTVPCSANGGILGGGPYEYCIGDGDSDFIKDGQIVLFNENAANFQWVLADINGNFIDLPNHYTDLEFDNLPEGTCNVFHVGYDDGLQGLTVGSNFNDLVGCYHVSNSVEIIKTDCSIPCMPNGGILLGGPFTFCVDDNDEDVISPNQLILEDNEGPNDRFVIALADGTMIGLVSDIDNLDFSSLPIGTCFLSNISFESNLVGLELGNNLNTDLVGCHGFSNQISITKTSCTTACGATAPSLSGGPIGFCVGDGEADMIAPGQVIATGGSGAVTAWVITDASANILSLPFDYLAVDFDLTPVGTCLLWQIRFEPGLSGLVVGANANDLAGCFALSNPIEIDRVDCTVEEEECPQQVINTLFGIIDNNLVILDQEVGTIKALMPITGGLSDEYSGFTYNSGDGKYYAITGRTTAPTLVTIDVQTAEATAVGLIVETAQPNNDFTIAESLEYNPDNGLMYLSAGRNPSGTNFFSRGLYTINTATAAVELVADITGSCQNEADGLVYANGDMYFMDGCPNPVAFGTINLMNGEQNVISSSFDYGSSSRLASNPLTGEIFFFDSTNNTLSTLSTDGVASALGVSYADSAFDGEITDIAFGPLTTDNTFGGIILGGIFEFCVSDDEPDFFEPGEVQLFSEVGPNQQWIVSNELGEILMLPVDYTTVDFGGFGPQGCFLWNLAYNPGISGLSVGQNVNELEGCFDLSNPILIMKVEDGAACQNIVEENDDELSFVVAGNPVYEELQLIDIQLPEGSGVVNVFDATGSLFITETITEKSMTINTTNLTSGLYFISIQSEGQTQVEKFIRIE